MAGCDSSTDPTPAACLTSEYGLFVSTAGSDAQGDGSPAHPFATVGHALHAPNTAGRIYICGGEYSERVALAPGATANLYGGFSCPEVTPGAGADAYASSAPADDASTDASAASWGPGGPATVFSPPIYDPTNNWVLAVDGVPSVTIQNVQFIAPTPSGSDAAGNGDSSFTAVVIGSTVQFVGATITAGRRVDGTPGAGGEATPNYAAPEAPSGTSPALNGAQVEEPGVGGVQMACANQDSSAGGNGGDNLNTLGPSAPTNGTAVPLPPPVTDAGTPPDDGLAGGSLPGMSSAGDPGAYGQPRDAGTMAMTFGALTSTASSATWAPTAGGAGGTGGPGQGGGGGAGLDSQGRAGIGGGGGAGGCGGTGGGGGAGGGASVALLSINSSLSLTGCTVITGGGGTGGQGGNGQDGQPGGAGASGSSDGGSGGSGAGGSGGAGGTGGLSAGVVFQGSAPPTIDSCTFTVGDPGHGGAGGPPGSTMQPWSGLPGGAGLDEYAVYGASLASVKTALEIF